MTHSPLVKAAADYLNRGLSVIALTGKTPNVTVHRTGLSNPIVGECMTAEDYQLVAGAFNHPDTTGIGIVIPYPYVVVDIDGEEGAEQFQALVYEDTFVEPRWVAKTPRLPAGGLHFWFACTTPTGSIKLGSKLDLKGQLSYVAAPPSKHPDGGTYEWLLPPGDEPIMEVPSSIRERIENHAFDLAMSMKAKEVRRIAWGPKYAEGDTVFYAQAGHDALIEGMATAADGNRNNYLHWAAATLAEENGSDEEFEALGKAALDLGLERVEVRRTIRSARRAHG